MSSCKRNLKKGLVVILSMVIVACSPQQDYRDPTLGPAVRAQLLLDELSLEEKVGQMAQFVGVNHIKQSEQHASKEELENGDAFGIYKNISAIDVEQMVSEGKIGSFLHIDDAKEVNHLQKLALQSKHKIPLLIAIDAIHGHGFYRPGATVFPTAIAMASTWDTEMSYEIAQVTAKEMRATGYHWTFSPNVEVATDPRWGRVGETFGEDPFVVSRHGVAMIQGYQGDLSAENNVLACAKHFIAGGDPRNGLNFTPMDVSERRLNEVFYPPFKAAVDAGVVSFMAAHNEVNGMPCHGNKKLMQEVLRNQWGFDGFVVSDWMDVSRLHSLHKIAKDEKEAYELAVKAGININMHGPDFYEAVIELVKEGTLQEARIDEMVYPILLNKFRLGLFEQPFADESIAGEILLADEHQQLALNAARKSLVLLENKEQILPLKKGIAKIFVSGPNANNQTVLGDWAHPQPEENVITVLEGLQKIAPESKLDYFDCGGIFDIDDNVINRAVVRAKQANVAILVVGENSLRHTRDKTCGENIARPDINLPGNQEALVRAIHEAGVPVILVLVNGRPLGIEWISENIPAVIESWEPGMKGGQAIAEVIFGDYNPGGKLAMTFSRSVGHVSEMYYHRPSQYFRKYATGKTGPLYPFGYGLSYTSFAYTNMNIKKEISIGEDQLVEVEVSNTGQVDGDEVVLVYINDLYSSVTTPVKKLVGFERIHLKAGESKKVSIAIKADAMALFNVSLEKVIEPGEFAVIIGDHTITAEYTVSK